MTKAVRVENADTSAHKVCVHVEQKDVNGDWQRIKTLNADLPTAMVTEYIHDSQRLVVEEVK